MAFAVVGPVALRLKSAMCRGPLARDICYGLVGCTGVSPTVLDALVDTIEEGDPSGCHPHWFYLTGSPST